MEHPSWGAHLEKLHTSKRVRARYSIRGNDGERLILIPVARDGQQHWILVDVLDKHQYEALSRKPKNWLNEELIEFQLASAEEDEEEAPEEQADEALLEFVEEYDIESYGGDYLILD